ncbi:MAG: aldose 1-epimerase family protein [Acidimicrobiales bacterium]
MAFSPTGEQFEISSGNQTAVAVEVGGGLRSYRVAGRDVLDGYGEAEMATGGRGQLLIPWPNRVARGRYCFGDRAHQLALTEPEQGNAIHGLVRWSSWRALERTASSVTLGLVLHPQPGWEYGGGFAVTYELGPEGLTVWLRATCLSDRPCPFGAGAHPYVLAGGPVDDLVVRAPARTMAVTDDRHVPTGTAPVEGTDFDFRSPARVGALALDTAYSDLDRDSEGNCTVAVTRPGPGRDGELRAGQGALDETVSIWLGPGFDHLMLFTGDTLVPAERRRSLAVEPMTCAADAFNNKVGLRVIEPGETFQARFGITTSLVT